MLVFEDDPYGLVRFEGEAPPTVFELAGGENVVYSSSFSKTIAPGLRVGYLVLPTGLAAEVESAAAAAYITPALLSQATVLRVPSPRQPRAEPRACPRSAPRLAATRWSRARPAPAGGGLDRPEGGYFLWLELPRRRRDGRPAC